VFEFGGYRQPNPALQTTIEGYFHNLYVQESSISLVSDSLFMFTCNAGYAIEPITN
jgi:hypothetical protein